jgi:uncharacterized protein
MARTIVEYFHPERIILFGSRARGDARPDSDVDLFIEIEADIPKPELRRKIRAALNPFPSAIDILVYTPAQTKKWQRAAASLVSTVLREGAVLYDRRKSTASPGMVQKS